MLKLSASLYSGSMIQVKSLEGLRKTFMHQRHPTRFDPRLPQAVRAPLQMASIALMHVKMTVPAKVERKASNFTRVAIVQRR